MHECVTQKSRITGETDNANIDPEYEILLALSNGILVREDQFNFGVQYRAHESTHQRTIARYVKALTH